MFIAEGVLANLRPSCDLEKLRTNSAGETLSDAGYENSTPPGLENPSVEKRFEI